MQSITAVVQLQSKSIYWHRYYSGEAHDSYRVSIKNVRSMSPVNKTQGELETSNEISNWEHGGACISMNLNIIVMSHKYYEIGLDNSYMSDSSQSMLR